MKNKSLRFSNISLNYLFVVSDKNKIKLELSSLVNVDSMASETSEAMKLLMMSSIIDLKYLKWKLKPNYTLKND